MNIKVPYNKQSNIPSDCLWEELKKLSGDLLDEKYKYILTTLAKKDGILKGIYADADNKIKKIHIVKRICWRHQEWSRTIFYAKNIY